jgi:opacity protein-like surface antigen
MKKIVLFTLFATAAAGAAFASACSSSPSTNDGGTDASPNDSGNDVQNNQDSGTDSGIPNPPTLKTQIDRMGRPAINTALNHEFDEPDAGTSGPAKDSYNADPNIANWKTTYAPAFEHSLAILDSLDTKTTAGDGCGNQFGYNLAGQGTFYAAVAGLMADDQLYVDTSKTTCSQYLAVELNALGALPNSDCGGREITGAAGSAPVLGYDVMNITLQVVAGLAISDAGALSVQESVTDGPTTAVSSKTTGTTFPYLAAPQ